MLYNLQFILIIKINKEISLPCPEDVGEIGRSSLILVFVFFPLFKLFFAVGSTSILHLWLKGFSNWLLFLRTTSGIRASQVRRGIIW